MAAFIGRLFSEPAPSSKAIQFEWVHRRTEPERYIQPVIFWHARSCLFQALQFAIAFASMLGRSPAEVSGGLSAEVALALLTHGDSVLWVVRGSVIPSANGAVAVAVANARQAIGGQRIHGCMARQTALRDWSSDAAVPRSCSLFQKSGGGTALAISPLSQTGMCDDVAPHPAALSR